MKIFCLIVCALALRAQPRAIGPGCTTAFYIDLDCDGFGVGKKASGVYPIGLNDQQGKPGTYTTGDMPDADDADPTVRTTAEWEAKWGANNAGITKFLQQRKGFMNTRRVWYVSLTGNNEKARVNDPTKPFRNIAPIVSALHEDLQGGAIIVRGGDWGADLSFNACAPNPCFHVTGVRNRPVYVMVYPGEKVETTRNISIDLNYWPNREAGSVTYDGFTLKAAQYGVGDAVSMVDADHMTFVNCEFAGWHQLFWGNHSEDITVKNNVFHDMMMHAVYFGFYEMAHKSEGEFDFEADAAAYRAGKSRGASSRAQVIGNVMYNNGDDGYDPIHINTFMRDALIEGNIVSYSGGSAITLQTGVVRSIVRNNVLFDGGNSGITLHLYSPDSAGIRGNIIENNTVWVGNPQDSIRRANPTYGITMNDDSPTGRGIKDTIIRNNVFVVYNDGSPSGSYAFSFLRNSFPDSHTIQNNVIWSSAGKPSAADRVMTIARDAYADGHDAGNYTFDRFQAYGSRIAGNLYADPRLADASPAYTLTPGKFDLRLLPGSPAIDAGRANELASDIAGSPRAAAPDAGAYEYTPVPVIRTKALPSPFATRNYQETLAVHGGASPYKWALAAGSLCEGLTLAAEGAITGTAAKAESCSFTLQVTDSAGKSATQALTVQVTAPPAR